MLGLDTLVAIALWKFALSIIVASALILLCALHFAYGFRLRSKSLASHPATSTKYNNINSEVNTKNTATHHNQLPTNFSLLTHNIWLLFFIGGSKRRKRIDILVANISNQSNLQILCFQEAFIFAFTPWLMLSYDFEYLAEKLSNLGYIYHTNPKDSLPKYLGMNNGLVTFSKQPFYKYKCHTFQTQRWTKISRRGCLQTVFKLNTPKTNRDGNQDVNNTSDGCQKFCVFNTHFENRIAKIKLQQMTDVTRMIASYDNDNEMSIASIDHEGDGANSSKLKSFMLCCGDFNICSNGTWQLDKPEKQRLYYKLCAAFRRVNMTYDCVGPIKESGIERTYRQTKVDYQASYDHIFVNQNAKNILVGDAKIADYKEKNVVVSDHYGVRAIFRQ